MNETSSLAAGDGSGEAPRLAGAAAREGRRIEMRGTVQGVGFRPWVYRLAVEEGVAGRVWNDAAGVRIEAFGSVDALAAFEARLKAAPPPAAVICDLSSVPIPAEAAPGFAIVASRGGEERRVSIPPDLATCPECARELLDPADRRFAYPFTNCTHCGPRFTIARGVPYDREATTMAVFAMCPDCRREYEDPADRRFHAQPNACPVCGPRLWAAAPSGEPLDGAEPLATAARALAAGMIVAVKGLGGFHLACDATSPAAVERLRRRKGRDEKPLAVMVPDLAAAARVAELGEEERGLLAAVERPIVLLRRREASGLAPEVAPRNPLVGLMLPYTPLHHLLLAAAGRPLVMTSANLSEEPIVFRNAEAVARLAGIADLLLLHDREIESRCDDSVARVVAGRPVVLRRSRGYVPRALPLARPVARPVLACGAHLKNTFCLASGGSAWLGPHVGDLETLAAYEWLEQAIERMERFLDVRPEVVACDLHPGYLSTHYARRRAGATPGMRAVAVQHHHAHVASAMAEHGLAGPVLGLAWDGTGYGTDGTAWGGELLLADFAGYERLATFRPLPLAGGDLAIREVWRLALAVLDDAFAGEPPLARIPLFAGVDPAHVALVRRMIAGGVQSPRARGAGRLFDAVGALVLGRADSHYEGQVAVEWNLVAEPAARGLYPFALDRVMDDAGEPDLLELDWRPLVRGAVADLLAGRSAGEISAKFHETLAGAAVAMVRAAVRARGEHPVVLTGGCFQNALLAERIAARLAPELPVHLHGEVPPGDGGIALGQALVAAELVSRLEGGPPCV